MNKGPDAVFKLTHAKNGLVIDAKIGRGEDKEEEKIVFANEEYNEKESWVGFLRLMTEYYGPSYNKWGKQEIHFDIRPGHKSELDEDVAWFLGEVSGAKPEAEIVEKVTALIHEWMESSWKTEATSA